uniref:CUT domain-containing protein n=1 Tax=Rhabditophanes sp. KR3021 TaxID=114890 RepID=A0AC35U5T2_9BILA
MTTPTTDISTKSETLKPYQRTAATEMRLAEERSMGPVGTKYRDEAENYKRLYEETKYDLAICEAKFKKADIAAKKNAAILVQADHEYKLEKNELLNEIQRLNICIENVRKAYPSGGRRNRHKRHGERSESQSSVDTSSSSVLSYDVQRPHINMASFIIAPPAVAAPVPVIQPVVKRIPPLIILGNDDEEEEVVVEPEEEVESELEKVEDEPMEEGAEEEAEVVEVEDEEEAEVVEVTKRKKTVIINKKKKISPKKIAGEFKKKVMDYGLSQCKVGLEILKLCGPRTSDFTLHPPKTYADATAKDRELYRKMFNFLTDKKALDTFCLHHRKHKGKSVEILATNPEILYE